MPLMRPLGLFFRRFRVLASVLPVLGLILLSPGCATQPPPRKPTIKEQMEFDRAIGTELAQQMDPQMSFRKASEVRNYLGQVVNTLVGRTPVLHLLDFKIFLIRSKAEKWQSYALPGGRLYLSTDLLKKFHFENEVAAMISIQLAHLLHEDVLNHLRRSPRGLPVHESNEASDLSASLTLRAPENINFFGPEGVLVFDDKENAKAIRTGIDLLYSAGYDTRGMVAYLQYLKAHLAHSPWNPAQLSRLLEIARDKIASQAPLLNPIVRTDRFLRIRPKIQRL